MGTITIEQANAAVRAGVESRLQAQAAGKSCDDWYDQKPQADDVHPTSRRFFELCDSLKAMHASKSRDYGCPTGTDPLANIRNGAKFVGIPAWRGAMVRLSDKVTRLATFNATGTLSHEGVEDNLLDLASYALLSLLLYQEEHGQP